MVTINLPPYKPTKNQEKKMKNQVLEAVTHHSYLDIMFSGFHSNI